jgi:hypothetical protein
MRVACKVMVNKQVSKKVDGAIGYYYLVGCDEGCVDGRDDG